MAYAEMQAQYQKYGIAMKGDAIVYLRSFI